MKEDRRALPSEISVAWNLSWKIQFMNNERFVNACLSQKVCKMEKLLRGIDLSIL